MQRKVLVVGLGNVGSMYNNTRHNVGFDVVDKLANILGEKFSHKPLLHTALAQHIGVNGTCIIAKPSRYMNNSGEVVMALCKWYKLSAQDCVIVTDNIDLLLGDLRFKQGVITADGKKKSSNTHNGIRSVIEHLGTTGFMRLYLGIGGSRRPQEDLASYVLRKWSVSEQDVYNCVCELAAQLLQHVLSDDFQSLSVRLSELKKELLSKK